MQKEINPLEGILDIVLPLAPLDNSWSNITVILIALAISGIGIAIIFYWWRSPRQHYKRKLKKLLHIHSHGNISSQQAVFTLAHILQQRIHCQKLSDSHPLPSHLQNQVSQWKTLIQELNIARYSRLNIDKPIFNKLAHKINFWICRW